MVPVAAAVANAVQDATGARVTTLPLTPERVFDALQALPRSAHSCTDPHRPNRLMAHPPWAGESRLHLVHYQNACSGRVHFVMKFKRLVVDP